MEKFNIGDWVYADDWCYGQIVNIDDGIACVEYDTGTRGGLCSFMIEDLVKADPPKKYITIDVYDAIKELESSKYQLIDTAYGYNGFFHQSHNCPMYFTEFSEYGKTVKLKDR